MSWIKLLRKLRVFLWMSDSVDISRELRKIAGGIANDPDDKVNPYLNTAPTTLKKQIPKAKGKKKKKLQEALDAWNTVVPYPFRGQG